MTAHVHLLGFLRVDVEDRELALPSSRKARLLLAMLTLERRVHGRSELAGRLWPEVREESARVSLRTALVQLRTALGDAADTIVRAERDGGLALAAEVRTDVEEVEQLLAAGRPEQALDRCGSELLAGFDEDWVKARREELRAGLAAALGRAAADAEAAGYLEAAVRLTRQQVGLDRLAEGPHRDLMRRLAATDDRGAALSVYDRLRVRFADELHIVPSLTTRQLADEIRTEGASEAGATRRSVKGRLDRAAPALVGREPERTELLRLLQPEGPSVSFIYGLAGVGKSALLRAFAAEVAARHVTVLEFDATAIEPSETGLVAAVSDALGAHLADPIAAADAIGAAGEKVVLTLDAYERLRPLDEWLRECWLPALPEHVRVVIAGRNAPAAAWSARYGPLLAQIPIDSLSPSDAVDLLRRLGVPAQRAADLNRVLRGHPRALKLAASARFHGATDNPVRYGLEELARLFLSGLDQPTRQALDAASVVRRVTVSLWAAMRPQSSPAEDFARLRRLPYVWSGEEGLIVFHVARSAIAAQLRSEDPSRYRRLRIAAWNQVRRELLRAPRSELGRYGADLLYLSDDPHIRDAFFPNTAPFYAVGPARAGDEVAIEKISRRHEHAAAVALVQAWSRAAPGAFVVARTHDNAVIGYATVCDTRFISRLEDDPIAVAWQAHERAHPLPENGRALCARHLLTLAAGEAPDPALAALLLDLVRRCLELRSHLRRLYACVRDHEDAAPRLDRLGFYPLNGQLPDVGGTPYHCYAVDVRSAADWLAEIVGRDLGVELSGDATGPLDAASQPVEAAGRYGRH